MVAVNLVTKGAVAIDQAAAAMLGAGSLSVFNVSTRVTGVVLAVGPESLGTALLPRFSELIARNTGVQARRFLIQALATAVILMTFVSGVLIWFSEPIVRIAFAHGALSGQDLHRVTQAQRWALTQVPFSVGLAILTRFVASLKANRSILPIWVAALAAHAILNYFVARRFGVTGILCVSAALEAMVLAAFCYRVFRRQPERDLTNGSLR